MAIDVKKIQLESRRITEISITYVKNHPTIPATLACLFPLYIFLPSLFVFLVFVVPIFIFIAVSFRLIFHIHQQNLRHAKGTHDASARKLTPSRGGRNLDKRGYSYAHAQSVRRRNSKKHELRVHFEDDMDDRDILFPSVSETPLVDKAALVEETAKEKLEVEVEPKIDKPKPECGDGSGLRAKKVSKEKLTKGENSEDEEEAPENRNKAVEWTEDDQKNLMDLGNSEMERNKRLESLIAKRKARKLLSLQVRKTLMNIGRTENSNEIASILIPKAGAFSRTKSGETILSPTPGSAPSVLLPVHNPFDLPYDPQEEKPNLLGGFQEEVLDNHHSDALFRRHESFNIGVFSPRPWELDPSPSESSSNRPDLEIMPKIREIPQFSRFKDQPGKEDLHETTKAETSQENKTVASTSSSQDPPQQSKAPEKAIDLSTRKVEDYIKNDIILNDIPSGDTISKVEGEPKLDTDDIQESISSSSSEINAPFSNANRDEILRSLSFSVRKNIPTPELDTNIRRDLFLYPENPSPYEKRVGNDPFFESVHTRSQSIASDLQVEVSEVGSQITNLSSDGGSPKYDVYVEKEGNLGNLDIWDAATQLKRVEENEARSGQVPEVSEQDIIEVGFKKINQEIQEQTIPESSQSATIKKVHEEVKLPISTNIPGILLNDKLILNQNNVVNPEDVSNSVEKFLADKQIVYDNLALRNSVGNVEEPSTPIEKFLANKQIVYDINDTVSLVQDDQGIIDFIQDTYGQDVETMEPTSKNEAKSVNIVTKQPENDTLNSVKSSEEKQKLQVDPELVAKGSEISGKNNSQVKVIGAEKGRSEASSSTSTRSMPTAKDKDASIPLEKNKQVIDTNNNTNMPEIKNLSNESQSSVSNVQVGSSEINPTLARPTEPIVFLGIDPTPIAVIPEAPVEQVAAASSTSSSPNSVLQHKFSVDLATSMSFDDVHLAALIANAEVDQNGISRENSAADVTRASDSVGPQESSVPLSRSTEETTNLSVNDRAANVQTSTAIGLLTPMTENEKSQTIKGVEAIEKSQSSRVSEAHPEPINTVEKLPKDSKVDKTHAGESSGLQSSVEDNKSKSINDVAVNEGTKDKLVHTSANISLPTPVKENEKIETTKGVEAVEKSQSSKEKEGHSKLDNTVGNLSKDSKADKTHAVDSVGLQKPSFPLSPSMEEKPNNAVKDGATNKDDKQKTAAMSLVTPKEENKKVETAKAVEAKDESQRSKVNEGLSKIDSTNGNTTKEGTGGELVKTSVNQGIIGSVKPMKEKENLEVAKGAEAIEKSQKPKELHNKVDNEPKTVVAPAEENKNSHVNDKATNKGTEDKLVQMSADIGSLKPIEGNEKNGTKNGGEAKEELQRPKEVESHAKLEKVINEGTGKELVQTSHSQVDTGSLTQMGAEIGSLKPVERIEKNETENGGKAKEELQRPEKVESHSKLEKAIKEDKGNELVQTSHSQVDTGSLTQMSADIGSLKPVERNETENGGKAKEEMQRPKEVESHSKLEKAMKEGTGNELVQTSHNQVDTGSLTRTIADIGSLKPTEGNGKNETKNGGEAKEELERPKEVESHSKLEKAINKGIGNESLGTSHNRVDTGSLTQMSTDIGLLKPMEGNETKNGSEMNEKIQRPKEAESHSKLDKAINEGTRNEAVGTSHNQADTGSLTPIKENEKGGEVTKQSERPKEIEGNPKPDNAIGKSESAGVAKIDSGNLAASGVKDDQESKVAPKESEKK